MDTDTIEELNTEITDLESVNAGLIEVIANAVKAIDKFTASNRALTDKQFEALDNISTDLEQAL